MTTSSKKEKGYSGSIDEAIDDTREVACLLRRSQIRLSSCYQKVVSE